MDTAVSEQEKVLAFAVYELGVLLAEHADGGTHSDPGVRAAAHLANAMNKQARAVLGGEPFDCEQAMEAIGQVDRKLGEDFMAHFSLLISLGKK